jgi:hypothetical protein
MLRRPRPHFCQKNRVGNWLEWEAVPNHSVPRVILCVSSNGMRAAARLPQDKALCSNSVKNFSNLVFVFESAFPGRIYQFQFQESWNYQDFFFFWILISEKGTLHCFKIPKFEDSLG